MEVFTDPSANGTATNTWTKPFRYKKIKVFVTGGGGGAGSQGNITTGDYGGGGGAGGTAIKILDVTNIDTCTVTVGAKGAGGCFWW